MENDILAMAPSSPSGPFSPSESIEDSFLSPRSKVAKMLADIDDDVDNTSTPSPPQRKALKARKGHDTALSPSLSRRASPKERLPLSRTQQKEPRPRSGSDSDSSAGVVSRPRGRAAQRMLGTQPSSPPEHALQDAQDDNEDLYSATPARHTQRSKAISSSSPVSEHGNGLFVSPSRSVEHESDDELPSNPFGGSGKLAELVAQKRAERLAREAEQKKQRQNTSSSESPNENFEDSQEVPGDATIDKILSDASRPARKASRRALLEMERETQRMSRQQALAHQMKVKKKFTTNDLFAKFNFKRSSGEMEVTNEQPTGGDSTASSAPNSDGIDERPKDPVSTPPSSPPTPFDKQKALVESGALSKLVPVREDSLASLAEIDPDEELPDVVELINSSQAPKRAQALQPEKTPRVERGLKLARFGKKTAIARAKYDSEDDLEIVQAMPAHLRAFDRATGSTRSGRPADSKAIHHLKHLSHFNTHEASAQKKGSRPSVNPKALEGQLRKRAKEQARQRQLERIDELRAKGIDVQTAEEREHEAEEFEDLLDKARNDAVELRKAEKTARLEAGGELAAEISDDEEEDSDYEISGSENGGMQGGDGEQERGDNAMIDEAAEETEEDDEDEGGVVDDEVEDEDPVEQDAEQAKAVNEGMEEELIEDEINNNEPKPAVRISYKSRIIKDDEDEDDDLNGAAEPGVEDDSLEESDPYAAFNFGAADLSNSLLSPTQAFNATMQTPTQASQEDSFDILRRFAPLSASSLPPTLPDLDTQFDEDSVHGVVASSQVPESQRISLNWETQPPETPKGLNGNAPDVTDTPGWEPTQDRGLPSPWGVGPGMNRENIVDSPNDRDTQSTVLLRVSESPAPSQKIPKRGKLGRRRVQVADDSDDEFHAPAELVGPEKRDAFREMARRRKEALTAIERAEADKEMREMMDEAAEESEDEYAGLGGDDYVAPENDQDREMIDTSHVDVDERALAAHFAERQRQADEAETSRLYKDLTTGVLRKKMGANAFDLDEDEDEIAARRRQMRQMEEAKKRRALLKDENIATLADGKQSKGKDAFLKAIADDDGDDDDVINISDEEDESVPATQGENTQSQSQLVDAQPLQETSGNKRRFADGERGDEARPPAKQRRTQALVSRRPTSLLEVQESVSFLLEEPNAAITFGSTTLELSSDSEHDEQGDEFSDGVDEDAEMDEEMARQNDGGFAPNPISMESKAMPPPRLPAAQRRTVVAPTVVDRLSLKRGPSTGSGSALGRTAWAAGPTTGGFKVPSLLRRATTSSKIGSNDRGVTTPNLSRDNSGSVRMGGTKKSSLAYQARAEERRTIVEASAKRREENTARIALLRRNSSALGRGLTGRFE